MPASVSRMRSPETGPASARPRAAWVVRELRNAIAGSDGGPRRHGRAASRRRIAALAAVRGCECGSGPGLDRAIRGNRTPAWSRLRSRFPHVGQPVRVFGLVSGSVFETSLVHERVFKRGVRREVGPLNLPGFQQRPQFFRRSRDPFFEFRLRVIVFVVFLVGIACAVVS